MNFEECMDFINSYSKSGGRITDLSRARELMERIGNPERSLRFVHIAGTNGKGSTLEYISNALILAGCKTGQFTSPFVTHYADRIRINGSEIGEDALCEICSRVKSCVADRQYSQFEITMAIAMLWYEREKCDVVVLETGIGGLLDSTNVIPPPLVSVITAVSLDHTAILGNTVEEIAAQKAGIIKEHSAVVAAADNPPSVLQVIANKASSVGAELIVPSPEHIKPLEIGIEGCVFTYHGDSFRTAMTGLHQVYNAVTAIEVCRYLNSRRGFNITEQTLKKALSETAVRARVQYIAGKPPVIVDGGHNPDGVKALVSALRSDVRGRKVYAVTGMVDSKDYVQCVKMIAETAEKMFTVEGYAPNCVPCEKLAESAGENAEAVGSLEEAVHKANALALENGGITVVCGSLYLASDFLCKYRGKPF